jgi:AcrR family transcriptional regulator
VSPRTGRRPGASGTREAILEAARRRFAERGYDRATIRGIAADAGVDGALVHYFYRSKEELFAAAMRLPTTPGELLASVLSVDRDKLGESVVRGVFGLWEDPDGRAAVLGLLRSAVSNEQAAAMMRQFVTRTILGRIVAALGTHDAQLRAELVGSQIIGLAIARYVVRLPSVASADVEDLVVAVGPTVQRYLTGDIRSAGG